MNGDELLLALSEMIDQKLTAQIEPLKNDITDVKNDMVEVKSDISVLKTDVAELKTGGSKNYGISLIVFIVHVSN